MNNNSIFCVIFHIVTLTCNDKVFQFFDTIFWVVFTLRVHSELNCQLIQWHKTIKNKLIFCASDCSNSEKNEEMHEPLFYSQYQKWMKHLREKTDFVQVLTTYCLC